MKSPPAWAVVATGLGFVLVALGVWFVPSIASADASAFGFVNGASLGSLLDSLMYALSIYGREYFWVAVVFVMLVAGDRRTKALGIGLAVLFVVGIAAGELAKELLFRTRPDVALQGVILRVPLETDSSFPSGHALIVSIGAVYALFAFRNRWIAGLLAIEAALVCFSRVYVGVHYPLDVAAGVFLGALISTAGLYVGSRYARAPVERLAGFFCRVLREGPLHF